jgi:hypothetical protein
MPRHSPLARTDNPVRSAASDLDPPARSTGTWPNAMKVNFFKSPFGPGDVKYSLFARNVTFLGITSGIKIESLNER